MFSVVRYPYASHFRIISISFKFHWFQCRHKMIPSLGFISIISALPHSENFSSIPDMINIDGWYAFNLMITFLKVPKVVIFVVSPEGTDIIYNWRILNLNHTIQVTTFNFELFSYSFCGVISRDVLQPQFWLVGIPYAWSVSDDVLYNSWSWI